MIPRIIIPTTKERRERLAECIKSLHEFAGMPFILCTYENEPRGGVIAIHEMLEGINDIELVWFMGDDTVLTEPDTLKRLFDRYDGGVLCPNDGIQEGKVITYPFCRAHYIKRYLYKGYYHNWGDQEFTDIMRAKGLYTYCPDIKLAHQHWTKGAVFDETYKGQFLKDNEDKALYESRRQRNLQ